MSNHYELEFEIEGLPKTTNGFKRQHWIHRYKEATLWKTLTANKILSNGPFKKLKRARIFLERHSSSCPDSDGLVSSFKHVLDGIVQTELIPDDSYKTIGMPKYLWVYAPRKKGKIKVKIQEII